MKQRDNEKKDNSIVFFSFSDTYKVVEFRLWCNAMIERSAFIFYFY